VPHILIVEDRESMATMLKETLEMEGYTVTVARDGREGIKIIKNEAFHLVITDLKLPYKSGLDVLKASQEEFPLVPVIVMTAYGTIETAVEAMKEGASDFITKPVDTDYLLMVMKKALDTQRLQTENLLFKDVYDQFIGAPVIIGSSPAMEGALTKMQKVSSTSATVLLLGESGTGKELFARAIHFLSPRKNNPFVPINCAAIPKDLLESEFFGHEKGSFTGAGQKKLGKFELADSGTIFLDEIGEMEFALQAKLLRVLQDGEIERVGGIRAMNVDVRVIAATNRDIENAVANKELREDLYYRLSVFPILIPPLRERREDIPLLAEHFVLKYTQQMKRPLKNISSEAMDVLINHYWKGNVRELENTIERAIILCDSATIKPEHLGLKMFEKTHFDGEDFMTQGTLEDVSKKALKIAESKRIKKALRDTDGNKTKAAEILNVSYKTLLTKIKEYNI
jgi:DNA-binding NtrC family response regulator